LIGLYAKDPSSMSPLVRNCGRLLTFLYFSLIIMCLGITILSLVHCDTHVLAPLLPICKKNANGRWMHLFPLSALLLGVIELLIVSTSFASLFTYIATGYTVIMLNLDIHLEMS
jgi:hypothetical protein